MHILGWQWSWNSSFSTKKLKILENIMDFLANVSFNSTVVPPTIQQVKLEKM